MVKRRFVAKTARRGLQRTQYFSIQSGTHLVLASGPNSLMKVTAGIGRLPFRELAEESYSTVVTWPGIVSLVDEKVCSGNR